jgi:hypothetical protein
VLERTGCILWARYQTLLQSNVVRHLQRASKTMALADVGDVLETGNYFVGFWAFVGKPSYRTRVLTRWREAEGLRKAHLAFNGVMATVIGLGLPVLIRWLIFT